MASLVIQSCVAEYLKCKKMAEAAMAQVTWEQCQVKINNQQNSVAAIVKHLAGNMRSRCTDFLTADGEKPDRDREAEFHPDYASREEMMQAWEAGWACVWKTMAELTDEDLGRTVHIRKEPHSVIGALNRQTTHYAHHIGQICLIAKHLKGEGWKYLTIPPGGTAEFNRKMGMR